MPKPKVILASASKRRAQILRSCGIKHKVVLSQIDEHMAEDHDPHKLTLYNAKLKAEDVAKKHRSSLVIGADTVVISRGKIIGKPKDEKHARAMLREFCGSEIKVVTGIYVIVKERNKAIGKTTESLIRVADLDTKTQAKLFPHLKPYDKAGGFSIEGVGSIIFDNIRGSYFNILGLPMNLLFELVRSIGVDFPF